MKTLYSNGDTTRNVYSASGEKLKSVHATGVEYALSADGDVLPPDLSADAFAGLETVEYRGPLVYRDGRLDMVLFEGGYATVAAGGSVTFHYYTCDYLGSNRAVVNGSTGAVEQTVAYYPYGGIIADLGFGLGRQPFKFGGKELISANGLNEYDFGARQYWHAVPGFNRIDPLCENFYWLSPYLYCGNDPVNAFDPDGRIWKDLKDIEELEKKVNARISKLEKEIEKFKGNVEKNKNNWNDKKLEKEKSKIVDRTYQVNLLNRSLEDIKLLGEDSNTYVLDNIGEGGAHMVFKSDDGMIHIQTSHIAISLHEITHVRQSLYNGGLRFSESGYLINSGIGNEGKCLMEIEAYRVQGSMNSNKLPIYIKWILDIDASYLDKIKLPDSSLSAYPFARKYLDENTEKK